MKSKIDRRTFIKSTAALPISFFYANSRVVAGEQNQNTMPAVPFGDMRISRLIIGSNTISGGSHLSRLVDFSMQEYFTDQKILEFFRRCQQEGINTFQGSSEKNIEIYHQYRQAGGKMHYLTLIHENSGVTIESAKKFGAMGLVYHGEVTDRLFKSGKIDQIPEFLKKMRDSGLLVGVSTHMPAVVDYIENKNWDIDFYMTCIYERHRTAEELRALLGHVPLPVREVYLEDDPVRMFKMIQATRKQCFAFKILAAGRVCQNNESIAKAFKSTFANIKATDAVIVGMFPRYTDQVKEDANFVRQYGSMV